MLWSRNQGNNLHLNMYAKVEMHGRKLTEVNNIEYYLKSCQVITDKVNCIYVQLKGLKILTAHRIDVYISNKYVTQL